MKLTASGVTFSAAITRSPSFSRSASSVTITIRPLAMSLTTSSIASNSNVSVVFVIIAAAIRYVSHAPEQRYFTGNSTLDVGRWTFSASVGGSAAPSGDAK